MTHNDMQMFSAMQRDIERLGKTIQDVQALTLRDISALDVRIEALESDYKLGTDADRGVREDSKEVDALMEKVREQLQGGFFNGNRMEFSGNGQDYCDRVVRPIITQLVRERDTAIAGHLADNTFQHVVQRAERAEAELAKSKGTKETLRRAELSNKNAINENRAMQPCVDVLRNFDFNVPTSNEWREKRIEALAKYNAVVTGEQKGGD